VRDFRFGCYVNDICALLGYYKVYSGNSVPTFREKFSLPSARFLKMLLIVFEDAIVSLSRNISMESPHYAALYPRIAPIPVYKFVMTSLSH